VSRSGKVLYDYQKYGIQFLRQQKRVILADDVGLGKSMQCLGAVEYPLLIIAPARAHQTWIDEIFDWLPNIDIYEDVVRYRGTVKQRAIIANDIKQHKPKIVISTYGMTREIQVNITPKWKTIIFDEAHVLRNRKAHTLYVTVRGFKSDRLYFVTANPVISGAKDYWTLLNMIDRNRFASYWKFVNRYCIVEDEFFGKNVLGTNPETAGELNALLKPYMLKRTASDVEIELPDFSRQFLRIDLSQRQKQVYEDLVTEYMHFLENNEIIIAENTLTRFVRLRQLLVCPRIIGVPDDGAALNALREEVETLTEGIAIFTPFREAIPYIQNALCELDYACYTIAGGMDENRVELNRRNFLQDAESGKKVALKLVNPRYSIFLYIGNGMGANLSRTK
jgi:SNF2 family DNA or RNA helicase